MQECPDETTSVKTSWLQSIFYFSFVTLPKTATLSRSHFFSRPYSGPTCTGENVVKGRIFTVCIFLKWFVQAFISGIFFVDVSISFETTSGEFGVCSTSLIQLWENNGPISPSEGEPGTKAGILFWSEHFSIFFLPILLFNMESWILNCLIRPFGYKWKQRLWLF